jgi:osmotically-inducible protein OsmY
VLADVQRLIAGSSALRDARIEIAVGNGIVTLSGEAPTTMAGDPRSASPAPLTA